MGLGGDRADRRTARVAAPVSGLGMLEWKLSSYSTPCEKCDIIEDADRIGPELLKDCVEALIYPYGLDRSVNYYMRLPDLPLLDRHSDVLYCNFSYPDLMLEDLGSQSIFTINNSQLREIILDLKGSRSVPILNLGFLVSICLVLEFHQSHRRRSSPFL